MTRPRPVLTAASIAATVQALAFVLGFLGFAKQETALDAEATAIGAVIVGAIAIGSHLLAALHAQSQVTPSADPRSNRGEPLAPVTQLSVVAQAIHRPSPYAQPDELGPGD